MWFSLLTSDYHHPDFIAYTSTLLVCHGAPRECGVFRSHPFREDGDVEIGSRTNYDQGTFSDYHSENIMGMQNVSPILIEGSYWSISLTSATGIFLSHALYHDWGDGLNVLDIIGSRLSKN